MTHHRWQRIRTSIRLSKDSRRKICGNQRIIAFSSKIINEQTPSIFIVELEASWTFNTRNLAQLSIHLFPITQRRCGLFHDDVFTGRRHTLTMSFGCFIFHKTIIGIAHFDDGCIDFTDYFSTLISKL